MPEVNVNAAGATVTSPVSELTTDTTTSEAGWVLSTTVNESVAPDSVVPVDPSDWTTESPNESSSALVTATVWSANGSKASAEDPSTTDRVTVAVWLPSRRSSSTPVTVIVCAVFQFEVVNVNVVGATFASPGSLDAADRTTSEAGWVSRTTVNASVLPPSVTAVEPPDWTVVNPAAAPAVVTQMSLYQDQNWPPRWPMTRLLALSK